MTQRKKKLNKKILAPRQEEVEYARWLRKIMNGFWTSTTPVFEAALVLPQHVSVGNVLNKNFVDIFLSKVGFKTLNKVVSNSLERSVAYFQEPISQISPDVLNRASSFEKQEKEKIADSLENEFAKRKQNLEDFRSSVLFNSPEKVELFSKKYEKPKYKFTDTWSRTEINGLNRDLAVMQATKLGYTQFRWDTSGDERVRDSHAKINGKIFDIRNLPKEYNDYNCRCVLTPIFD